jgi:hypothetical protein
MKKFPSKKRTDKPTLQEQPLGRKQRPPSTVDPIRLVNASIERIRVVYEQTGKAALLGEPRSMTELVAQSALLGIGRQMPPSYVTAMRITSKLGPPDELLTAAQMKARSQALVDEFGVDAARYLPFCARHEQLFCFDKRPSGNEPGAAVSEELAVMLVEGATVCHAHYNFAEWMDAVADTREEIVTAAANLPARLKRLLHELGFRFDYPVIGRLETGDVEAMEELLGPERSRIIRGSTERLFDASGKAWLTLNVDDFSMTCTLRDGLHNFGAADVFRWLRYFRDENLLTSDVLREPSHPDRTRDLRRAHREPPMVVRGRLELEAKPARRHVLRGATGPTKDDFFLLGKPTDGTGAGASFILRVKGGVVVGAHAVDESFSDLLLTRTGQTWGLGTNTAYLVQGALGRPFPLPSNSPHPEFRGLAELDGRVFVWGRGTLLVFDGQAFVPFAPDARLDPQEEVIALAGHGGKLQMLVFEDGMGALAYYDGLGWVPIQEEHVIHGAVTDMDVRSGSPIVVARTGAAYRLDARRPRQLLWDADAHAVSFIACAKWTAAPSWAPTAA